MALHRDFPESPYAILDPELRWFPADEDLRDKGYDRLLPPLVAILRRRIKEWRDSGYQGASSTSSALLKWWFQTEQLIPAEDGRLYLFQYYFSQREAVEAVIYLYEIVRVKDKYDLLRFDSSGMVSAGMFDEDWKRFVIKMATGSGKTKVMALILEWSYFHRLYEEDSTLARNFLVIAPNIIVLDRLKNDFEGLKIFFADPMLPYNGYEGQDWGNDFQLTLHIQDDVNIVRKTGNIFLTNIHRVYDSTLQDASYDDEDTMDYFLGKKPVGATNESKVDLGEIVRNVDELMVINDEAHHIHDPRLAWFKSIQDINNRMKMKGGELSMQIDVTATPRHNNGAIFVQTIVDYPLVEAIYQNVVKHPVLPDSASRAKLEEKKSSKYTEKYEDYLHLGYLEWKKAYEEHVKLGQKAILFIMTDDTKNCDEVAAYLENRYPELNNAVLVIHTKNNGEISESDTKQSKEELERLRQAANGIDNFESKYKAIVSVLMLKEGWDVRNVTTIVGLRAYTSKSNILPEQTLGRGLRRMYRGFDDVSEMVSVVGTDAFMDFVESIKNEGVMLEHRKMGEGSGAKTPVVVEVDNDNPKKDIEHLNINVPVLSARLYRNYKNLSQLNVAAFGVPRIKVIEFSEEEQREIIFRDITSNEITHRTVLDKGLTAYYQSVVGYLTQAIMKELHLISGYDILYEKVKYFIRDYLFETQVDLDDSNILRNLSEIKAVKTIHEVFKKHINDLTVADKGEAEIRDYITLNKCRPFVAKEQGYLIPKKSVFNRIIGDSGFELEFAAFLDDCEDIISFAKNYLAVHFNIEYKNAAGDLSNYYPDFLVKKSVNEVYIVETKGQVDVDVAPKLERLIQWCQDVNVVQGNVVYTPLYVRDEDFKKYRPANFDDLAKNFGIDQNKALQMYREA